MAWERCQCGQNISYPTLNDLRFGQSCGLCGNTREYSEEEKLDCLINILIDKLAEFEK